jgi:hypothetical protein
MPETILIIANDAGGANLLASWCAENDQNHYVYCVTGPAESLFREIIGSFENQQQRQLEEAFAGVDRVLCATGGDAGQLIESVHIARQKSIPSVVIMDHWAHYALRFGGDSEFLSNLPDHIWVFDKYAFAQAVKDGFPRGIISLHDNPYFERIARKVQEIRSNIGDPKSVLYLSEPVTEPLEENGQQVEAPGYGGEGYDEYELIEDVIRVVAESGMETLVIRRHPLESINKYEDLPGRWPDLNIIFSDNSDLAIDLAGAVAVIGSNSTALALAHEIGIDAISYIPEGGKPCVLPHDTVITARTKSRLAGFLAEIQLSE